MSYTITQISKLTGLSTSAIRYYESQGLIKNITRNSNGRRVYTNRDLEVINLIKCLRELGVSIKLMKKEYRI